MWEYWKTTPESVVSFSEANEKKKKLLQPVPKVKTYLLPAFFFWRGGIQNLQNTDQKKVLFILYWRNYASIAWERNGELGFKHSVF